jgi:hypothetical protein
MSTLPLEWVGVQSLKELVQESVLPEKGLFRVRSDENRYLARRVVVPFYRAKDTIYNVRFLHYKALSGLHRKTQATSLLVLDARRSMEMCVLVLDHYISLHLRLWHVLEALSGI